jgi:uncharacterized protein (DUF1499 family)
MIKHFKLGIFSTIGVFLFACGSEQPDHAGLKEGQLQACPESPNCVQSFDETDESHYQSPLPLINGSTQESMEALVAAVNSMPRTEIISQESNYLHVTYTTAVFRFVDDVEFLIGPEYVDFRSSSRLGYYDFGVNNRRMKAFRKEYEEQ